MSARALFETALEAARVWHAQLPEAAAFCNWPDDLSWQDRASQRFEAADLIVAAPGVPSPASAALLGALQGVADHVEWRHSYTVEEVGQNFLDNFGWFELAGPEGHFHTTQARITVGYWGPDLFYPRHQHAAEELYTIVSGTALFHADGDPDVTLGAEGVKLHHSDQPHALTTSHSPVLTLVFWRGTGLDDPPRMTP